MSGEDELAFLKAYQGELSPAVLRELKRTSLRRRRGEKTEAAAKTKGSGERPTGQPSGRQPGSVGGEDFGFPEGPRATAGKRKANELDSSDSGGSMELATRRPGHCPEQGPRLCLHRQSEAPPKARWVNPPLPRANNPSSAAGNSARLRLARRKPG
jgi:hypothetical protein